MLSCHLINTYVHVVKVYEVKSRFLCRVKVELPWIKRKCKILSETCVKINIGPMTTYISEMYVIHVFVVYNDLSCYERLFPLVMWSSNN